MPSRKKKTATPTAAKPPKGFKIVTSGKVCLGAIAWASEKQVWKNLQPSEVGKDVSDYVALAVKE